MNMNVEGVQIMHIADIFLQSSGHVLRQKHHHVKEKHLWYNSVIWQQGCSGEQKQPRQSLTTQ